MPFTIRKLTPETLPPAVDALAAAFFDDPGFRYFFPKDDHRRRWFPVVFRESLRTTLPYGHTYALTDEHGATLGAVGATPPGEYPHPTWRNLRLFWIGFWKPRPWCPPIRRYRPFLKYFRAMEKMHLKTPHWYVDVVGVRPGHQGKGIGRQLMRVILDLADRDERPTYLETGTEPNVAFYRSLGFDITETIRPTKTGPPVHAMLRPPPPAP